jgi:MFS family permease
MIERSVAQGPSASDLSWQIAADSEALRADSVRVVEARARPALVLAAVAVVQFTVSLDLSVVNVGLPQIAAGLGFGPVGLTWVIHAYALAFGGLLLLGGKAADRYGRKQVLLSGLGVFGLASLVGGFAQAPGQLVAARAVQGVGAAALAPAALALLTAYALGLTLCAVLLVAAVVIAVAVLPARTPMEKEAS